MEALPTCSLLFLLPSSSPSSLTARFRVMEIRPHIFSFYFYISSEEKETKNKIGYLVILLKCVSSLKICFENLERPLLLQSITKPLLKYVWSLYFAGWDTLKAWSLVWQPKQCKATPAIFSKRRALRPIVWHERSIKRKEERLGCQIKMIKKNERAKKKKKKRGNERMRRQSEFLRGSGLAWTCWNTHCNWWRRWERGRQKDEEDREQEEEEEFRAPAEGQAPARWFRPHGPSRRWEYQTLWLPKTHRVWLGLWASTVTPSPALGCVGYVSPLPFCQVYSRPFPPPNPLSSPWCD